MYMSFYCQTQNCTELSRGSCYCFLYNWLITSHSTTLAQPVLHTDKAWSLSSFMLPHNPPYPWAGQLKCPLLDSEPQCLLFVYFFMPFIYLTDKITPHPDTLITQHSSSEGLQRLVTVWEDWGPQMNAPGLVDKTCMRLSNTRNYEVEITALIHTELEFLRCGALQLTQLWLPVTHDRGPILNAAISFRLFIFATVCL